MNLILNPSPNPKYYLALLVQVLSMMTTSTEPLNRNPVQKLTKAENEKMQLHKSMIGLFQWLIKMLFPNVQCASSQVNEIITSVPKGTAPSVGMLFKTFSICDSFLRSFGCNEQLSSIIISVGPQKTWCKNGNKYRQVKAPP